jgi:hypothetical protein
VSYNFDAAQFKQKLVQLPKLLWLPIGYLLLALLHSLILQVLPVPVAMPPALAASLQQHPVTVAEIEQSVERLAKLKKLAEL